MAKYPLCYCDPVKNIQCSGSPYCMYDDSGMRCECTSKVKFAKTDDKGNPMIAWNSEEEFNLYAIKEFEKQGDEKYRRVVKRLGKHCISDKQRIIALEEEIEYYRKKIKELELHIEKTSISKL